MVKILNPMHGDSLGQLELFRALSVLACAAALILAGQPLPY